MTPPSFIRGRLFRSEWAPHPQFFPNIFTLDDFRFLPSGMNLTEVNNLFPPTVFFREVSGGVSGGNTTYRMIINSFPPFLIAAPLELRYQLEVRETTGLTKLERQAYEVTVRVRWVVGGNERTFTLKRLVAHGW